MVSSLSFSLEVRAIMISLCFRSRFLYLSTWAFSCSISFRSPSNCSNFLLYYSRILYLCSFKAFRNWTVSSILWPPISTYEFMIRIFSSSFFFFSLSWKNSLDLISRAATAVILSSSAFRFSLSSFEIWPTSYVEFFWCSCSLSRFSSISYFRRRARWSTSSLIVAVFLMFLARLANFRLDSDSP